MSNSPQIGFFSPLSLTLTFELNLELKIVKVRWFWTLCFLVFAISLSLNANLANTCLMCSLQCVLVLFCYVKIYNHLFNFLNSFNVL